MSIDVGRALREGADDLLSARGAALYVLFAVFAVASLPVHQTLIEQLYEWIMQVPGVSPDQLVVPPTPLALGVDLSVLVAALAVIFVVSEMLRLVAVRSFASESPGAIPTGDVTENFGRTFLVLLLASVLVQALVFGGVVLFVVPGLIAAVLVVFFRQAVLLDDDGVLGALQTSVSTVVDNVLEVVAILVTLIVVGFVVGIPMIVLPPESVARSIVGAFLGAVPTVYGVAVVTAAYLQIGEDASAALGPDDLDGEDFQAEPADRTD